MHVEPIRLMTSDELSFFTVTPVADYGKYHLKKDDINGVNAKAFLRDQNGDDWIVKSGAYDDPRQKRLDDICEQSRRLAFPLNEAISAAVQQIVGLKCEPVALGFREIYNSALKSNEELLVSLRRLRSDVIRRSCATSFTPSAAYKLDLLCMLCVDEVLGQKDRKTHNYMVDSIPRVFPIDSEACMHDGWLIATISKAQLEQLNVPDGEITLDLTSQTLIAALKSRLTPLTEHTVELVFSGLPDEIVAYHNAQIKPGPYTSGGLLEKMNRVKSNVSVLRTWVGLD